MDEIWKNIKGYEGLYQASSLGRIRSLDRVVPYKGGRRFYSGKILLPRDNKKGYLFLCLCKNNVVKRFYVHKVIAETFLDNPLNLTEVNHKDECKNNNTVDNLEFCTHKYNCQYGNRNIKTKEICSIPVLQYDLDGNFLKEYNSGAEAERITGVLNTSINQCINGKQYHAGSFYWCRKISEEFPKKIKIELKVRRVLQYNSNGDLLNEYNSIMDASRKTGVCSANIGMCCRKDQDTIQQEDLFGNLKNKNMKQFQIREVPLSSIKLIKKNARFMEQSMFNQLVNNIRRDGQLSSVPFCVEHDNGTYTVVSGNHRIQAANMAGLTSCHIMYINEKDISNDEIRAIQLSANSINGQDDQEIIKQLLDEITDVALKEYAHISNEVLESVKDINYTVEMPNNEIVPVTLMFVDTQKVSFDKLMETLDCYSEKELGNLTLLDMETMYRLNEVSAKVQAKYKIKAQALSICKMLEIVNNVLEGSKDGTEVQA